MWPSDVGRFDLIRSGTRAADPLSPTKHRAGWQAPPRTVLTGTLSSITTRCAVGSERPVRCEDCRGAQVPGSVTAAFIPGAAVPFLGDSSLDLPPASIGCRRIIYPAVDLSCHPQFSSGSGSNSAEVCSGSRRVQRTNRLIYSIPREVVFRFVSVVCRWSAIVHPSPHRRLWSLHLRKIQLATFAGC